MVDFLRTCFIVHASDHTIETDTDMYSKILQELEDAGMLPPDQWESKSGHPFNEWESE